MKTDDLLVSLLLSATSLVKKLEVVPMSDDLRFYIMSARLSLVAAVAHAAQHTVIRDEVH